MATFTIQVPDSMGMDASNMSALMYEALSCLYFERIDIGNYMADRYPVEGHKMSDVYRDITWRENIRDHIMTQILQADKIARGIGQGSIQEVR